jgi:PIN domain nuclease of toxin-antitoxin system
LGLKVDLVHSNKLVDAEAVLASNIHEEATHPSEVEVPQAAISDVDVTEEIAGDEFAVVTADDQGSVDTAANAADVADDMALISADGDDETTDTDNEEKET